MGNPPTSRPYVVGRAIPPAATPFTAQQTADRGASVRTRRPGRPVVAPRTDGLLKGETG